MINHDSALFGMGLSLWACGPLIRDFGPPDTEPMTDLNGVHASCLADNGLILQTPESGAYKQYFKQGFTRYAQAGAPGGGFIPIFAQDQVPDEKGLRARNLMRFFLSDVADSQYGQDKSAVADSMVANGAVLMMPNGAHERGQGAEAQCPTAV